jgi:hypothetical protein
MTRYFGDSSHILDDRNAPAYLGDRAPLTREEDPFGNTVDYYWRASTPVATGDIYVSPATYYIERIEYTKNASVEAGEHFAEVRFDYGSKVYCNGEAMAVGGVSDFRGGILRIEG